MLHPPPPDKYLLPLLLLLTLIPIISAQPPITPLTLNNHTSIIQNSNQLKYFSVQIPQPSSDQILLLTASADINTYIDIHISVSTDDNFTDKNRYPDEQVHSHECFYRGLDTCAIQLQNSSDTITVYFSIEVDDPCTYILGVSLQNVYEIHANKNYTVNFADTQAAILKLDGSQYVQNGEKVQEMVIQATYVDYQSLGYFQIIAAVDRLPEQGSSEIISESLNVYNKLIVLPGLKNQSSFYYVLLQGTLNTKIQLVVYPIFSLTNPSLQLNSSIAYITNQPLLYTYNHPFDSQTLNSTQYLLPLFINLYALRGYGIFFIQYCNGLYNFTFQNTNGENGQIVISSDMRLECYDEVAGVGGGLLIQNLEIAIQEIVYDFGYEIYLAEGEYQIMLYGGQKEYGVLLDTDDMRLFNIYNGYSNSTDYQLMAIVQTITGNLNYQIQSCTTHKKKTTCQNITQPLTVTTNDSLQYFNFTCPTKSQCSLLITHVDPKQSQSSQFVVSVSTSAASVTQIPPNTPIVNVVELNAYNFYMINITSLRANKSIQFSNLTVVQIRNTVVNGDILILTSARIPMPEFSDIFAKDSDVRVTWQGLITYTITENSPQCIYISVLGEAQSIYYLQYSFNTSANIPQRYMNIIDDAQNDYTLTASAPYILIKYSSHILPFSIKFSPMPDCIAFGTSLPFNQSCVNNVPTQFHNKVVYFNISQHFLNKQDSFKFNAYANSGDYLLEQDRPAIIACLDSCYEFLSVLVKSDEARIIHSGYGTIKQIPNGQEISNTVLTLLCSKPPCSFQLNASLPYGGQMQISYQSQKSAEIQWYTKPFSFLKTNKFFIRLPKYGFEATNIIFYSEAVSLAVFYNVISLDQNYENTMAYQYPDLEHFDGVYLSDPLRSISIVTLDEGVLEAKGCNQANSLCIATLTIYGNTRFQYSMEYIKEGLGYYSSSSFSFSLSLNQPIQLKRSYSITNFYYIYTEDTPNTPLYLSIEALSNCRPVIQLQNSLNMFYRSLEIPKRMPGQSVVKFQVLTYQLCRFETAITTVPYEVLLSNVMYPIEYSYKNNTEAIYTYHQTYYFAASSLEISTSSIVDAIIVSQLSLDNPIPPSQSNQIAAAYKTRTLTLPTPESTKTYLISIQQTNPSQFQSIILINKNRPIILLHNQQFQYTFHPSPQPSNDNNSLLTDTAITFEYETNNNFLIFISVNTNSVNLTVSIQDAFGIHQQELVSTIITNQSEPWIVVNRAEIDSDSNFSSNVNNQLKNYVIKVTDVSVGGGEQTKVSLHVEEDGILGLPALYDGVSYYDSLLHFQAMNCYQYVPPKLVKPSHIQVDLNFINNGDDIADIANGESKDIIRGIISLYKETKTINLRFYKLTPSTYRMTAQYYPQAIYKICYQLLDPAYKGAQYSVVMNTPAMSMIYPLEEVYKFDPRTNYQVYEYINHGQTQQLQISLTNCLGKSDILASSSYHDMMTGKMTEIQPQWQWSVGGVSTSIANVSHGYYYIGAKNKNNSMSQIYQLNVRDAIKVDGKTEILESLFAINWKIKSRAYTLERDDVEMVGLEIPPIQPLGKLKASKIVYMLYLMNLEDPEVKKLPYSINAYSRCPLLMPSLKPFTTNQTLSQSSIYFQIPLQKFQPESNLSIRAQVTIQLPSYQQSNLTKTYNIYYYYGYEEIIVEYNSGSGVWGVFKAILIIIFVISSILGIALAVRAYLIRKRRNTVSFQASNIGNGEMEMQQRKPEKSVKPINKDIGYGQFIDQIP